jgi:predicted nucleic acid-binding protein
LSVLPALFDTSIYMAALRRGDAGVLAIRRLGSGSVVWLSAVVLEELYAGCSYGSRDVVKRLERDFDGANRILVPNLSDWARVGEILARLGATHGYEEIGRGRLTSDALIAMSAARLGIQVMTTNKRDFQRLAEFRPFHWILEKI